MERGTKGLAKMPATAKHGDCVVAGGDPVVATFVPKASTKALLIDVAEKFFGSQGLEGSSLREIAAAAGQKNYNAVQYHFGSKRGLINAILDKRFREVDAIRATMIETRFSGKRLTDLEIIDLLRLIWEPVLAIGPWNRVCNLCRFQLQFRLNSREADHPFYVLGESPIPVEKIDRSGDYPRVYEVAVALRGRLADVDSATFHRRTAMISYMFLCFVVEQDNAGLTSDRAAFDRDLGSILTMMAAALSSPA